MSVWRHLVEKMPGVLGLKDGMAFSLGTTPTLPTCESRREGEERLVRGTTGVATRRVICRKDAADAYGWNTLSPRASTVVTLFVADQTAGDSVWTDMPAAVTAWFGETPNAAEVILDTSQATEFRLSVRVGVTGSANAELFIEYWTGAAWADAAAVAGAGDVSIAATNTTQVGTFAAFTANARATSALLRLAGKGGNGAADPTFGLVVLEYR